MGTDRSWIITPRSLILILSLADPFYVVYRLQVLGLECWQFEMDISSAHPGGCRGEYMLTASFPLLCKNEQCVSTPLV